VLYGYSTSINQTKPMMLIALIALLLNGLVNWLLVFGNWGFPKLGGVGCAWATMICVWFHPLALLWWMRRSQAYRRTWPFSRWESPQWPMLRTLLRLGLPIGVTYFAETSAFSLIALLIAKFGSAQVGAHAIALNFTSLTFMVPLSLGLALLTRVGQSLGAGDPVAARFRAWVGVGLTLVIAVLSAASMALFSQAIASAYTSDAVIAGLAAHLLVFAALFQLSDCSQVVTSCAIRGYKVTRAPMVLHLTAFWGVSLPLGCVLGLAPQWLPFAPAEPMAAQGFWIALIVGLTVAAVGLVLMLRKVARQRILPA
jgi:MATE family multidrug resistance protein